MAVYFAQAADGGPIKIGTSRNIDLRIRELETHYGRPMVLLGWTKGGREEERRVHEKFAHLRLGGTEQFRPASDLLQFIGLPLFANDRPDVARLPVAVKRSGNAFAVRGSDEWRAWVVRLSDFCRLNISQLVDRSMEAYAQSEGFTERPPMR